MSINANECRKVLSDRLEEAGISTERFVDVKDGEKASIDHTCRKPGEVSGNYGVYATARDGLVWIDIDDYNDIDDSSGLTAIMRLPSTFEQKSPHDGTHRAYKVAMSDDGRQIAAVLKDEFGLTKGNPAPSWGEVRAANQYVVGAGSQLDGCDKEGCEECATGEGGRYEIANDRPIATIEASELVEALRKDPEYAPDNDQTDLETVSYDEKDHTGLSDDADEREILEYALEDSSDDKLRRLWEGDYSDYGGDRSRAESALAYKLAFWLNGDKNAVRRAMNRANTQKWDERTDESYRESVLQAVDKQTEFYEPQSDGDIRERAPAYDTEQVERGVRLLSSETKPEEPAGELVYQNGHYCYPRKIKDPETGQVKRIEYDTVTNFTLELLEKLTLDDGRTMLKIRVQPAHPADDSYDVEVPPTVFNEPRSFKENIVRGTNTTFNTQGKTQQAINDLRRTVGSQFAPTRTGVEHIGLHGDEFDEWVTPDGVVTSEGHADDPDHAYYAKGGGSESDGGAVARKWSLNPETVDDYDSEEVSRILELLPQTRRTERGVPVLGWFYSAPLRPLIHKWTGEFNLLQVVGVTGTGKTTFLKVLWEAFGMEPDPFDASDTPFTHMKHMASSNGVPVWIDEYKPADIRNDRLDEFHRLLRAATKGRAVPKGRANLGEVLFHLRAPVVVSGEQKFSNSIPAVRRRAIMTNLSKMATDEGSSYARAFAKLSGRESYENSDGKIIYPDGYDLHEHARAYYQFVLEKPNNELKEMWDSAGEDTKQYLTDLGVALENTERQGAQTVLFGIRLYREFANTIGADVSVLPTESDVIDSFEHMASNVGKNGQRRGYADSFLELFAQASSNGYVQAGEAYRVVESQKFGGEVIAFHMPTVYSAVKKYVRDFNLEDEFNVIAKNDYIDEFKDKIERGGSYVEAVNHGTRFDGDKVKCAVIDHQYAAKVLGSDFDLRAFGIETDDTDDAGDGVEQTQNRAYSRVLATIAAGYGKEFTATAASVDAGEYNREAQGMLKGQHGTFIGFVVPGGNNNPLEGKQGETFHFENVTIRTNEDGLLEAVINDATAITQIDNTQATGLSAKATDVGSGETGENADTGGTEAPPEDATGTLANAQRLRLILEEKGRLSKSALFGTAADRYGIDVPEEATPALEKGQCEGLIEAKGGDEFVSI